MKSYPEALDEFEDAARYYAACQEGLGLRFSSVVFRFKIFSPWLSRHFGREQELVTGQKCARDEFVWLMELD
jgi:hypothetical protein